MDLGTVVPHDECGESEEVVADACNACSGVGGTVPIGIVGLPGEMVAVVRVGALRSGGAGLGDGSDIAHGVVGVSGVTRGVPIPALPIGGGSKPPERVIGEVIPGGGGRWKPLVPLDGGDAPAPSGCGRRGSQWSLVSEFLGEERT